MKRVLAIILGGGKGSRLYPLTKMRAKPAVPLAGKYRLIDIPISNCINSGIEKMYVLTQFNSASLNRHIGRTYNLNGPFGQGFVEVLAAQQTPDSPKWFEGTADAVRKYQWLFQEWDVDDLQEVVSRNQEFRQKIAKEAESLVEEERIIFLEWWASLEAVPVINKLRSDLELIRKEELQKALSRMGPDFSARERKVVEALTKGIINKILHTPVTKLRSPQPREERQVSLKIVEKLFSLVKEDKNN